MSSDARRVAVLNALMPRQVPVPGPTQGGRYRLRPGATAAGTNLIDALFPRMGGRLENNQWTSFRDAQLWKDWVARSRFFDSAWGS